RGTILSPWCQTHRSHARGFKKYDLHHEEAIMFDQISSENTARSRRPLAVALSFAGQVLLVTLAVVAPLLHTETIAPGHLLRTISAPQRLRAVRVFTQIERAPAGAYRETPGPRFITDHVFRQPARVPSAILPEMKGPSPDLLAGLS